MESEKCNQNRICTAAICGALLNDIFLIEGFQLKPIYYLISKSEWNTAAKYIFVCTLKCAIFTFLFVNKMIDFYL